MNETMQNIFNRRSIRNFKSDRLSSEQLQQLAQTALASPTGMNQQSWHFAFVTNQELITKVNDAAFASFKRENQQDIIERMKKRHESIFYGAPLVVFISMPKSNDNLIDAGIAVMNLAIAAQSMGLGSCIIGLAGAAFSGRVKDDLKNELEFPPCHEFAISVAIGYPAMDKEPHDMRPEKVTFIK